MLLKKKYMCVDKFIFDWFRKGVWLFINGIVVNFEFCDVKY